MSDDQLNALLGPGSPTRDMLSDLSTLYAAFPSFIYPVLSEKGGKGVDDHDRVARVSAREHTRLEDVIGRARDTIDLVLGVVFADDERVQVAETIREIHRFIHGDLTDGTGYHAWERDLWNWTWASIVYPLMDIHDQLRGWPSTADRQPAYDGFLAVGELFGANGLPRRYEDFLAYRDGAWMDSVDPYAAQATGYLLTQVRTPSPIRALPWLPERVQHTMLWPIRHIARTGLLLSATPALASALGLDLSWSDRLSLALHRAVWKVVPRWFSRRWIDWYMRGRLRYGTV